MEKGDDLALKRIRLSILDIEACIETDSGSLVQRLELMYPRFLSRIENVDAAAHLTCRVLVKKRPAGSVPRDLAEWAVAGYQPRHRFGSDCA